MSVRAAPLRIAAEGWEALIDPAMGASLLSLRHHGVDVLRPTPQTPASPLEASCFPLVPYVNRVAGGRFTWAGEEYALPLSDPMAANSLHGVGWERPWEVAATGSSHVRLTYAHGGDAGWPWRFSAEQTLQLLPEAIELTLSARNDDTVAGPMGLGLHPYLATGYKTQLRTEVAGTLLVDSQLLPMREAPADYFADWEAGEALSLAAPIDHCLTGWNGRAVLTDGTRACVVTAEGATALHVYAPEGASFACLEPVSHLPDALNRGGMPVLEPGESAQVTMRITVTQ